MPEIHCIVGYENSGKTTVQVKLFESILRIYDNYSIDVCKYSINTMGDFLTDIAISLSDSQNSILNLYNQKCTSIELKNNSTKNQLKILLQSAGDQISNYKILKEKIRQKIIKIDNYDLIIFCLSTKNKTTSIKYHKDINTIQSKINLKNKAYNKLFNDLWLHVKASTFHNCYNGVDNQFNSLVIKLLARVDEKIKKLY